MKNWIPKSERGRWVILMLLIIVGSWLSAKFSPDNRSLPEGMKGLWTVQSNERVAVDEIVNFEFVHDIVYDISYYQDGKLHVDFYWWSEGVHSMDLPSHRVEVVRENQPNDADYNAAISQRKHYIRQDMVNWGIEEVVISIYREGVLVEYYSYQIG